MGGAEGGGARAACDPQSIEDTAPILGVVPIRRRSHSAPMPLAFWSRAARVPTPRPRLECLCAGATRVPRHSGARSRAAHTPLTCRRASGMRRPPERRMSGSGAARERHGSGTGTECERRSSSTWETMRKRFVGRRLKQLGLLLTGAL